MAKTLKTTTLHLVQLSLPRGELSRWASGSGLYLDDCAKGDLGYIVHSFLRAAFGEKGPQPFTAIARGRQVEVLGYTDADRETLLAAAALTAEPRVKDLIDASGLAVKAMPAFPSGFRLGFEIQMAPVARTRRREGDIYLITQKAGKEASREEVYLDWMARRFGDAAEVRHMNLAYWRLEKVTRRDGKRELKSTTKPRALFKGELVVKDPDSFAEILRQGLGRHRTFGQGMLLLRPAR